MHDDLKAVRDKLFAGSTLVREKVTLSNGVEIDVLGMSVNTRGSIMLKGMSPTGKLDEDGDPEETLDMAKLTPLLLIESTRFTGTDTPVFSVADTELIGSMDATYLDPLIKKAMTLSGLGKKPLDDAKGNSGAIPA